MTERGGRLDTLDAAARHAAFDAPFTLTHDATHFYGYDAFGNTIARSGSTPQGKQLIYRAHLVVSYILQQSALTMNPRAFAIYQTLQDLTGQFGAPPP